MVKQVIVMRKDLKNVKGEKVHTGKLISQGAHAAMSFLTRRIADVNSYINHDGISGDILIKFKNDVDFLSIDEWLGNSFTKVTLKVHSEAELLKIFELAIEAGLLVHLIKDNGTTEFGGVPTYTCLAIGPNEAEEIDKITGHLSLF